MDPQSKSKSSSVVTLLIIAVIVVALGVVFFGKKNPPPLVGGERDLHGCLVAAGFAFDANVDACTRAFDMTPDITEAAKLAVAHVGGSYALTVASFNSYEEPGAFDIRLERGAERTPITVVIKNGKVESPSVDKKTITELLSQKLNIDANTIITTIDTDAGDFAKGQIHFTEESGGGLWFGAKTAKGWEVAYSGNGIMSCSVANQYNFPKDLVPKCLDDEAPHDLIER